MALFDKLKGIADKAKETVKDVAGVTKGIASSVAKDVGKLGNSPRAQAAREEARQAEYARIDAERAAEQQALKEKMERIANGDPDDERWEFLQDATDEQIAQLEAMEAAKDVADFQNRRQAREASGYAKRLLEESCACDQVADCGWYCTTCFDLFYANCGNGMLCERKQNYKDAGSFDELLFPDSMEYLARLFALEEGGPAAKKDRFRDVVAEFTEAYIPHFANLKESAVAETIQELGIGKKNYKLMFLAQMSHKPENMTEDYFVQFLNVLQEPPTDAEAARTYYESMEKILDNPSLYRKSYGKEIWDEEEGAYVFDRDDYREFKYLVKIFGQIYNPERLQEIFAYPKVVNPEELFTDSGEIKETGIYQKDGNDYDTVYGVVEYWGAKSEKLAARNG